MGITISLPDPLLECAKAEAALQGRTLSEYVEDAVRLHLYRRPNASPGREFKLITFDGGGLVDPTIDLNRTSELLARDDEEQYGRH